jgi:hypothetical protein
MKRIVFSLLQPATLALIVLFWAGAPASLLDKAWAITAASIATLAMVQALEFANERHSSWRLSAREFLTDLFYVILYYAVIVTVETKLADEPLASAKHALGITTAWAMHLPFVVQVALVVFLVEFGQYWMHRLMHNSFVWWTHAPHHHITQLNAAKGLVGNPLELFLVSLSVIALFDLPKNDILHRQRLDPDPSGVQPVLENNVKHKAGRHGDGVIQPPRWRRRDRPLRAPPVGDAVCNRPREESTE